MPTTQEDFDALETSLRSNNIQDAKQMLQNFNLTATDERGWTCLMVASSYSSSPEVVKLVFDKIVEASDTALLKSQLTATTNGGATCLMNSCGAFSSPEVVKLILEKIVEAGDTALLKSQLTATDENGWTCLMFACDRTSLSPEIVKLLSDKILAVGDTALLKSQLTTTEKYGLTCLKLACRHASSPEVVKLVLEKIIEVGDKDLLKSHLTATDSDGWTFLVLAKYSSSPEVVKLFAAVLFELDLFSSQYVKLPDDAKNKLKEKTGIDSSSWTPEAASLAEVKDILEGRVHGKTLNNSTADNNKKASGTAVTITPATIRKYFDFFDHAKTGLMEKSSMCAAIVACFPMTSAIAITERVRQAKCKETNQEKLDFDDFCCILNDIL